MRTIGNILWFIFGGLLGGLAWVFDVIQKVVLVVVIALVLVTGFLISNTIKLTIF